MKRWDDEGVKEGTGINAACKMAPDYGAQESAGVLEGRASVTTTSREEEDERWRREGSDYNVRR